MTHRRTLLDAGLIVLALSIALLFGLGSALAPPAHGLGARSSAPSAAAELGSEAPPPGTTSATVDLGDTTLPVAGIGEVPQKAHASAYGPGIWHHAPQGKTWYGAYRTFDTGFAYCIDAGKQSPLPSYFTHARPTSVTSAQTAWALHTYATSGSKDVHAALSAMARLDKRIPHDHTVPPKAPGDLGTKFAASAKQYRAITADAKKFAGPYSLDIVLTPVTEMPKFEAYGNEKSADQSEKQSERKQKTPSDSGFAKKPAGTDQPANPSPTVNPNPQTDVPTAKHPSTDVDSPKLPAGPTKFVDLQLTLRSAAGTAIADVPVTITTTGTTATKPLALTTASKPVTTRLELGGPGTVTASASAAVPSDSVLLFKPSKASVQRVVTAAKPVTVKAKTSVSVSSQPRVTTEISDSTPKPGADVTDAFTVSGLVGSHTVDVTHTLWSTSTRPTPGVKNPDAEVIATVVSKGVGNGTHRSPAITVPDDFTGWMYFTETIPGDDSTKEWTAVHGQTDETGFVPWRPSASTKAELIRPKDPDAPQVRDAVTIVGLQPGSTVKVTVTAYRSESEPVQSAKADGTKLDVQTKTITADEDGRAGFTTAAIDMPVGWVTFVVAIAESDTHEAWTSDWGIPDETVERKKDAETPPPTQTPPPTEEPTPPPATQPPAPKPDESKPPVEKPTVETPPAEQPPAPQPPAQPVAEQPPAPEPEAPAQLPRTGPAGTGPLIGIALVLMGLGVGAFAIGSRRSDNG